MAYWNFDDGTAKDRTANHNDGTLMNNATLVTSDAPVTSTSRRAEVNCFSLANRMAGCSPGWRPMTLALCSGDSLARTTLAGSGTRLRA